MAIPQFEGKIAAVTGGARGLGRALVEALAESGADVAFSWHEGHDAARAAEGALRARGRRVFQRRADARRRGEVEAFVGEAAAALGGLDFLVNNAGVFRETPLGGVDDDLLDEAFDVNVKAAIRAAQAAAPHLRARRGAVVNVASLGGLRPWPRHAAYCASKAALVMATRCLALALAPDVRVNAVAPGVLDPPGGPDGLAARIPQGRLGTQAEAVEAILFLLGGARYTTGEVLRVDGGRALN